MRRPQLGFADSNVVLYSLDARYPDKRTTAQSLLTNGRTRVSPQVALESANNLIRKLGYERHEIGPSLDFLLPLMHPTTAGTIEHAWALMARYQLKIWDAAIFAAAISAHCTVLYSEDFQHGQTIEGLRIVNPFL